MAMGISRYLRHIIGSDAAAKIGFGFACLALIYVFGAATVHYNLFPYPQAVTAVREVKIALGFRKERLKWRYYQYQRALDTQTVVYAPDKMMPGLTLISGFTTGPEHDVRIVDRNGEIVQQWRIDWNILWPDPTHLPQKILDMKSQHLMGVVLAQNGDLVFNIAGWGMVRMSPCGQVRWKVAYRAHHAMYQDDDGNFWVPGEISHTQASPEFRNYKPPFEEFTVLKVSPKGEILSEVSINKLLAANGYSGLLHMSTIVDHRTNVTGDTLHLNDVETFPKSLPEGVFKHGDVLISMRNINTILVYDPETLKIKYIDSGRFLRQHDADFVDGDTISVFDNNNTLDTWFDNQNASDPSKGHATRIVSVSAASGAMTTLYEGRETAPFFTNIMGTHQTLGNGNRLITESVTGRAFEIDASGDIVWEYFNIIGPNRTAVVDDSQRLAAQFDKAFFDQARATCAQ